MLLPRHVIRWHGRRPGYQLVTIIAIILLSNTNNNFHLGQVPWDDEIKSTTDSWLNQDRRLSNCPKYNKFPKFGGYCYVGAPGDSEYKVCFQSRSYSHFIFPFPWWMYYTKSPHSWLSVRFNLETLSLKRWVCLERQIIQSITFLKSSNISSWENP